MFKAQLSALSLIAFCGGVFGEDYHISSASDLIQFSNNVSSGTTYSGATVFLDADIDFSGGLSEQFEPIGTYDKYFQGTFDGQGHTIRNLAIDFSLWYIGLFGYSKGATIRNVVLDSSCSVLSTCDDYSEAYAGGIVGYYEANNGPCIIENIVNMASVSFTGQSNQLLHFGGIVGWLQASNKEITVKNCVNYGSVTLSGTANEANIGGIVGLSSGKYSKHIQNCFNYGTITHSGASTTELSIGGI